MAPSPSYLRGCDKLIRSFWVASTKPMLVSNLGLTMTMRIILMAPECDCGRLRQRCYVILECRDQDDPDQIYALLG
jgi:hypothetical protein